MIALLLIIIPVFIGLVCLFTPGKIAKWLAICGALLTIAITKYLLFFSSDFLNASFTQITLPWVPTLGIQFKLGMDGISMVLVLLTNAVAFLVALSSFQNRPYSDNNLFYALVMFMQAALIGVFSALDCFLFYVFWEAALLPVYFIATIWGGEDKIKVTFKFFIYTVFGSLFMLVAIIYLYLQTPAPHTFDWEALSQLQLDSTQEFWVFAAFMLAFAIKMPLFPLHTWQPDTYTVAPTPATMLLSGVMLKMGFFGMLRWLAPIVPFAFAEWAGVLIILSVIGVVYGSVIAIMQKDFKRLVAYSSIAHVGLIAAGVFSGAIEGLQGAIIQMFNHGINVVGLFFVLEIIAQRTGTRQISELGGIAHKAPLLAVCFLIILLGTVALPLTNGFVGEFMLLLSVYKYNMWMGAVAGLTIILGAVYMLRMYKNIMLGEPNAVTSHFEDLNGYELMVLVPICITIIAIGVYPNVLLQVSAPIAENLIDYMAESALKLSFNGF